MIRTACLTLAVAFLPNACAPPEPVHAVGGERFEFTRVSPGAIGTDASSSPSASWVDIDGDGDDDLYVLAGFGSLEDPPVPQPNRLLLNDGAGSFGAVDEHPLLDELTFSGSATWGDYDNDGDLDVFVGNQRDAPNFLYRNDGGGVFARVADQPPALDRGSSFSAVWVDIDNDSWIDLHVLNGRDGEGGQPDFLYRNLGDGRFERVVDVPFIGEALPSGGAAWGDHDGDGDADLFLPVYSTAGDSRLYRNDGDWTFADVSDVLEDAGSPLPYSPATSVAHWVDVDNDLDLDLFVGNTRGTIDHLLENVGGGALRRAEAGRVGLDATYVSDATWGDLDNDADLDLVVAVWGGASELFANSGAGRFRQVHGGDIGSEVGFASSVAAGDYDRDGDLDLYLTTWPIDESGGAPNRLYRNDTRAGNWLEVAVEGTESNRAGIGAKVVVVASVDGRVVRQLRHVTSRTSWRSSGTLARHFGLASAQAVDEVRVVWPSGRIDTIRTDIPLNRRIRIREGRGIVE